MSLPALMPVLYLLQTLMRYSSSVLLNSYIAFDRYSDMALSTGAASSITFLPALGFFSAFVRMVTVSSSPVKNNVYACSLLDTRTALSLSQEISFDWTFRSEKYGVYQLLSITVLTDCDCMSKDVIFPSMSILQSSPEVTAL